METVNLIKDSNGNTTHIAIPYNFIKDYFPADFSVKSISDYFEDIAMNRAMDESKKTDLLSLKDAEKYLVELE